MDFITDLPLCGGFNGIYTCIDKLSEVCQAYPCFTSGREPYQLLR